jgi:hypothetical protein
VGACRYLIAKSRIQNLRCDHVDASAAEELRQLLFHADETQTRHVPRFEFAEHVDITVRPKVIAQDGAKKRQPLNVVPSAKRRNYLRVDRQLRGHDLDP